MDGSLGEAVKVMFPPTPQKLGTEEAMVIGVTFTVTWNRGPSQAPSNSDT